ncbi:MAG: YggS family pyridoxal phosphate-dependent enzyme [Elusimicrobiota bacterium]
MILEKLKTVRERIAVAAARADRKPEEVELVAVTKYASLEDVRELVRGGVRQLAESRVQNAIARRQALGDDARDVRWRFIGHLQRNKVKQALEMFSDLDSIDSLRLAQTVQDRAAALGRTVPVLLQVKITDKETQSGVAPDELEELLAKTNAMPNLRAAGLMVIAPHLEPVEETRPHFREMYKIFQRLFPGTYRTGEGPYLSMGMSRDYEIAVEEGANLVRIGSSLFEK